MTTTKVKLNKSNEIENNRCSNYFIGFCVRTAYCMCLFVCERQISKKDAGVYEVVVKDDRGKDTSTLNLTDHGDVHIWSKKSSEFLLVYSKNIKPACSFVNVCSLFVGFKDLMNEVFSVIGKKFIFNMSYWRSVFTVYHHLDTVIRVTRWRSVCSANSSTPLKIQSTEEGIRLYSFVSYYNDELHVTWHHKWDSLFPKMKICCAICFKNKSWLGRKYNLSKISHS